MAQQHKICTCFMPGVQNCTAADRRSEYVSCARILSDQALAMFIWIFSFAALFVETCWWCSCVWIAALTMGVTPSVLADYLGRKLYENSHVCIGLPLTRGVTYRIREESFNIYLDGKIWYTQTINFTTAQGQTEGLFYSIALFFGLNGICFLTIVACYICIFYTVYASGKKVGRQLEMRKQLKLSAKVSAIVATDFCCWFPIIVIGILGRTGAVAIHPGAFAWLVTFVLPINSAIYPFLYTLATVISSCTKQTLMDLRTMNTPLPSPMPSPMVSRNQTPMATPLVQRSRIYRLLYTYPTTARLLSYCFWRNFTFTKRHQSSVSNYINATASYMVCLILK